MAAGADTAKTHICTGCEFPIAVYGRLRPCLHAFCLQCAATLTKCAICQEEVARIERVAKEDGLFISPLTLQSFTSDAEMQEHVAAIRRRMHR